MSTFELGNYTATQWVFFFYIYCFFGWIWETSIVSVQSKHFVNRGFMHGPFLPIYGSGAIVILISTLAVKDSIILVFICGMISSTILEYFTGAAMEKMFHVRYWDYTDHKLNLNGYICAFASFGWGLFSILLVRVIHPPIEEFFMEFPITYIDVVSLALTVVICVDMTISFNEAMDLKRILIKMAESNDELRKLHEKADFMIAIAHEEVKIKNEERREKKMNAQERFMHNLNYARLRKNQALEDLQLKIEDSELIHKIEEQKYKIQQRTDEQYVHSSRILKRNPGTVSRKHKKELDEILKLFK